MPQELPPPDKLFDLYKIAIDEYRFEVKLNTDRMIHYLVFNAALLSAGTGLLKLGNDTIMDGLVAIVFLTGIFTTWLGRRAITQGHAYYRRATYKKTLLEDLLGLHQPVRDYPGATLAVTTTYGQAQIHQTLYNPDALSRPPGKASITRAGIIVLWLLTVADTAGIGAAIMPLVLPHIRHLLPH